MPSGLVADSLKRLRALRSGIERRVSWRMQRATVAAASAAFLAALVALGFYKPTERLVLDPSTFELQPGFAAVARLESPPFWLTSVTDHRGPYSKLVLLENGRPLGPAHSSAADIGAQGSGRYTHLGSRSDGGELISFSASDNSNPQTNGRLYEAVRPLVPRMMLYGALFAAYGAVMLVLGFLFAKVIRADLDKTGNWLRHGTQGDPKRALALALVGGYGGRPFLTGAFWAVALSAALACVLYYVFLLSSGATVGSSFAGTFQLSDSKDYWVCANQIIEDGQTSIWCHRRPLYSYFLAGLAMLLGRDLELVLLAQMALVGICVAVFCREVARWLGVLAAICAGLVVLSYARAFVVGQTMSEVLGLSLGLLGAAALLRAGELRSQSAATIGVFLLALAMAARPGALFALPLVVLWAAVLARPNFWAIARGGALAVSAVLCAFALHSVAVATSGGDPANSNSNSAQVLYGLSVGEDWASLLRDRPDLVAETRENTRAIIDLSLDNIRERPSVFVSALTFNLKVYLYNPWYIFLLPHGVFYLMLGGLAATAAASFVSPRARLVGAIALGELASSLFLARDANLRVWAASGALAQTLPLLLLSALMARPLILRALGDLWRPAKTPPERALDPNMLAPAALMLLILSAPLTPLRAAWSSKAPSTATCEAGLTAASVDFGAANRIEISKEVRDPRSLPRQIDPEDAAAGLVRANSWFADDVRQLPEGDYVGAVTLGPGLGSYVGLYAPPGIELPEVGVSTVCIAPQASFPIAGVPFSEVRMLASAP